MSSIQNEFSKGLHTSNDPGLQPEGSYTFAKNFFRNDAGSLTNERQLEFISQVVKEGSIIIGSCVLEQDIILFFASDEQTGIYDNYAEIGIFNSINNSYTPVLITDIAYVFGNAKFVSNYEILNFKKSNPIDAEARKNFKGERVVYFTDNLNEPRRINLDEVLSPSFDIDNLDSLIKLQLEVKLSKLQYSEVPITLDGLLLSGKYQFAIRYSDGNGNNTSFGIPTNPISITDDTETINADSYDGCPPLTQTVKAINIEFYNRETTYPYVEFLAISFEGIQNTIKTKLVGRLEVPNTPSIIRFKYTGLEFIQELTLSEFLIKPIFYSKAKHILQKDNRLLLSNLESVNDAVSFQDVANRIKVCFKTDTTLKHSEPNSRKINYEIRANANNEPEVKFKDQTSEIISITGSYKDPKLCDKVGYMGDEVYAFALVPIFTDGSFGFAYHIPAPDPNSDEWLNALILDQVPPYLSQELYPEEYSQYGLTGQIRHHKMPPRSLFPYSILHLEFKNIFFSQEQEKLIQGYIITRGERNSITNRTILYQGIGKGLNKSQFTDPVNNYTSAGLTTQPGLGRIRLTGYWKSMLGENSVTFDNIKNTTSVVNGNLVVEYPNCVKRGISQMFIPDLIHDIYPNYIPSKIELVGAQIGKLKQLDNRNASPANFFIPGDYFNALHFINVEAESNIYKYHKYLYADNIYPSEVNIVDFKNYHNNTDDIVRDNSQFFKTINGSVNEDDYYWVSPYGSPVNLFKITDSFGAPAYLPKYLNIGNNNTSGIQFGQWNTVGFDAKRNIEDADNSNGYDYDKYVAPYNSNDNKFNKEELVEIYNFKTSNTSPYGKLETLEYVICDYFLEKPLIPQDKIVYGGDTYIQKYYISFQEYIVGERGNDNGIWNFSISNLVGFFLESEQNYLLRHYVDSPIDNQGTKPYFPKYKTIFSSTGSDFGIAQALPELGFATSYNKQYGFKNTILKYFPKPFLFRENYKFSNRVVYSEISVENEQIDAFRILLPNNYHDIPKSKGEITDIFELLGSLYIHTKMSLFKAFMNEQTAITTDSGEVQLGNGGLFPRPSIEIVPVSGGYAGCNSKWASLNIPFARFFVDNINKKVFILGQEGLEEISNFGMYGWFLRNIPDDGNNRFLLNGMSTIYDNTNKRVLLSKRATNINGSQNDGWTISYYPSQKCWVSFHDLNFQWGELVGVKTYLTATPLTEDDKLDAYYNYSNPSFRYGNSIFELNKSILTKYSEITIPVAKDPLNNKKYDGLSIYAESFHLNEFQNRQFMDNGLLPLEFLRAYNSEMDSLKKPVEYKESQLDGLYQNSRDIIWMRRNNRDYKLPLPRNTRFNMITNPSYPQRLAGKYLVIHLFFGNITDKDGGTIPNLCVNLHSITTEVRVSKR